MWTECGQNVGRMWVECEVECEQSRIWAEGEQYVRQLWSWEHNVGQNVSRMCAECRQNVGRMWAECGWNVGGMWTKREQNIKFILYLYIYKWKLQNMNRRWKEQNLDGGLLRLWNIITHTLIYLLYTILHTVQFLHILYPFAYLNFLQMRNRH